MHAAPLNIFQRTQRLWDTLHPYNAGQAMELAQRFTPTEIERAFNDALADMGLGTFVVTGGSYTIAPEAPPYLTFSQSAEPVQRLLAVQMNQRFEATRSVPFRPFLCDLGETQTIGVVYQHWPADSVSIRMLMQRWLLHLLKRPAAPAPIDLPAGGLFHYYGPAIADWSLMQHVWDVLGFSARMKRMRRVVETGADAGEVDVILKTFRPGLIGAIRDRSRRERLTVGDVFVAALAEACSKHGPNLPTDHRPDLALGTIVDLRSRSSRVPRNVFGLFLGFTTSAFAYDELYDFDALLHAARRQRIAALARKSADASQLNMALGLGIAKWIGGGKRLMEFYRKRFALSGGISNVNLTHEWPGAFHPAVVRAYHRTSPTGPMMPLVLTPTTLGDQLSVCCTYRTALTEQGRPGDVVDAFEDRLTRYAS